MDYLFAAFASGAIAWMAHGLGRMARENRLLALAVRRLDCGCDLLERRVAEIECPTLGSLHGRPMPAEAVADSPYFDDEDAADWPSTLLMPPACSIEVGDGLDAPEFLDGEGVAS